MLRSIASCMCLLGTLVATQHASAASFVQLGSQRGSPFTSIALSDDGSIVVGATIYHISIHYAVTSEAFRWTSHEGITKLGYLPGHNSSNARGVSADGSVIVGSSSDNALNGTGYEAFRWTSAGGMVGLGHLPDGDRSHAFDVSSDGTVIVGSSGTIEGWQPVRWTSAEGIVGLGHLPGGGSVYGYARAVSSDGSVIVGSSNSKAFRWTMDAGMVDLGSLPGGGSSSASDVSADGSVIVGVSSSQAFRWTSTEGIVGLGDLPGGDTASSALAVSADGSRIVGHANSARGQEAFLWDATHGMRSLHDVLMDEGIDMSGWTLRSATAISDDGTVIAGYGFSAENQSQGWVATIAPVPEPSAAVVMLLGVATLAIGWCATLVRR